MFLVAGAGCGGCELEALAALGAGYGALRRGIRLVESPAHADVLLVCGPLAGPLTEPAQCLERSLHAPWLRLRLGDCAGPEAPGALLSGCPPGPAEILAAIEAAWEEHGRRGDEPAEEASP